MDYTAAPLLFRAKKVLRYAAMYGPSRTYVKVLGQYHMRRRFASLPSRAAEPPSDRPVALFGCGNYAYSTIAFYLSQSHGPVIGSCMDVDEHRAASLAKHYGIPFYTSDPAEIMRSDHVRHVFIASNHASHAEYAIEALKRGKNVFIEKPHVVSEDQLDRLMSVMRTSAGRVFLGFNRPVSRFGRLIRNALEAQPGTGMYNWFVAGHEIEPEHWYFKPEEGGRVLGNLCHWTDFTLRLVQQPHPIRIIPARSRDADCDIAVSYVFGDGSVGIISFSAKGHTFEGVKERFSGHKGNCLISMDDYRRLTIEVVDQKRRYFNPFRDHGHGANILAAFDLMRDRSRPYDHEKQLAHVRDSGALFLATRRALESSREVVIDPRDGPGIAASHAVA
jgi:predicted dehydrogenase